MVETTTPLPSPASGPERTSKPSGKDRTALEPVDRRAERTRLLDQLRVKLEANLRRRTLLLWQERTLVLQQCRMMTERHRGTVLYRVIVAWLAYQSSRTVHLVAAVHSLRRCAAKALRGWRAAAAAAAAGAAGLSPRAVHSSVQEDACSC